MTADTSPDAALEKVRSNLGEGRYRAAQNLAREAAARFFPGEHRTFVEHVAELLASRASSFIAPGSSATGTPWPKPAG